MAAASVAVRLNAITGEFEKAFSGATRTVAGFERTFGNAASSLEGHKKRIDAAFSSFSGDAIIREANAYAAAVQRVGGVSALTAAEQTRVNATITEAISKYKALGQEAPAALHALQAQTSQLVHTVEPLPAHLQNIGTSTSKAGGYFNDLTTQVKATALGFIGAQAVIGGVRTAVHGLTEFVGESVQAYAAQEAAVKKMTTALAAQGQATPAVIAQYKALASQFQNTTVNSDELINEMQALLTQVGDVMPKDMDRALQAATDLSSGLGVDLRTATLLVGKAFEGETGTLKRYGIVIDEAKLKTEGTTAVLDAIQQKFGGQAQAEIETYAGKVKQLANAWDEVKESVGRVIVEDPALEALLRNAKEQLDGVNASADTASQSTLLEWWNTLAGGGNAGNIAVIAIEHLATVDNLLAQINRQMAQMQKATLPPALFRGVGAPAIPGADMAAVQKEWDQQIKLEKEAKDAAEQHAKAIRDLADAYSGAKAIQAASDALEAVNRNLNAGHTIAEMSEEQQIALNKYVTAGIEVYEREGRTVPAALSQIQQATQGIIDVQDDAKASLDEWAEAVKQHNEEYKRGEEETLAFLQQQEQARIDDAKAALDDYAEVVRRHQEEQKAGEQETLKALEDQHKHYQEAVKAVRELQGAITELAQASGGAFGDIVGDIGGFIGSILRATLAIDEFKGGLSAFKGGDTLSGIAGMASGILGIASAAIVAGKALAELFDRNKGRDLVTAFAGEHGGFDALHNELLQLGQEGERLWINLTQGVGRNNPEQARKAIEVIAEALKKLGPASLPEQASAAGFNTIKELQDAAVEAEHLFEFMRDSGQYSAEAVQAAWERANAALIASGDQQAIAAQKAHDAIAALDSQIKSLQDSIANEAPEAERGIIEQRTLDEIAAIQARRDAEQQALDETGAAAETMAEHASNAFKDKFTSAADAAAAIMAGDLQHTLDAADFVARLRFEYELPEGISVTANVPAFASGGIVRRPTLALVGEAGPEAIVPLSQFRGRGGETSTVILEAEGRTLARIVVPHIPGEVQRYGLV